MKGSCTTIILKDLFFVFLATLGLEPEPSVHETDMQTFTLYHFNIFIYVIFNNKLEKKNKSSLVHYYIYIIIFIHIYKDVGDI